MSQEVLRCIFDGQLPMHFFMRTDVDHLQDLKRAGYLQVSFGQEYNHRTCATVTGVTPLGHAAIRYFGFETGTPHSEASPVTERSALSVVVQELGLSDFSWALMMNQSSSGLAERLAESSSHFPDYDQALDAGLVALQEFCA